MYIGYYEDFWLKYFKYNQNRIYKTKVSQLMGHVSNAKYKYYKVLQYNKCVIRCIQVCMYV